MKSFVEYLQEANLYQKGSSGRKWNKFKDNTKLSQVVFEIEHGEKKVPVFDSAGNQIETVKGKDRLKILNNKEQIFPQFRPNSAPAVKVQLAGGTKGWVQLNKIRNPFAAGSTTAKEDLVHGSIRSRFAKIADSTKGEGFTLYMDGRHKAEHVVDIIQPRGTPKADFAIIDKKGRQVGFISHKDAGGAKAFQQYGGITPRSSKLDKLGTNQMIKEVDQFIQDLEEHLRVNPEDEKVSRIYRPVKSKALVAFSIFGPEITTRQFGLDYVNIIGQGEAIIEPFKDGYNLTFSESTHHGDKSVAWAMRGQMQAVLIARRSPGENRGMQGIKTRVRVEGRRGMIAPKALLSGSSVEI